jgi:hypothetical protein
MDALFVRCALSVLEEAAAGRQVDPSRLDWARRTLAQQEAGSK